MKKSPEVEKVLNQIEALYLTDKEDKDRSKLLGDLAKHLDRPYSRIYEWVMSRKFQPELTTFLELRDWSIEAETKLSGSEHRAFRKNLKIVNAKRNAN